MDKSERLKLFENELNLIKNGDIRKFAEIIIKDILPDYYFSIPSSSGGKYHPKYALGDGGLVRHAKAVARIAVELSRVNFFNITPEKLDLVIVAGLVHDGFKSGRIQHQFTLADHPVIMKNVLLETREIADILPKEVFNVFLGLIETHMGQWNKDYKTGEVVMSEPSTGIQRFMHLCDYIASRKCLEMNFDVPLSAN